MGFVTAFKLDFGMFSGDVGGHFLDLLGHFVDAAAEVENVVWTYYLLQIKHMGICQQRPKKS